MMREWWMRGLDFLGGAGLGVMFFGGLWWTVRRIAHVRQPALWFGLSLLARSAVVVSGLYWLAGQQIMRWLACVLGFVLVQRLAVRWVGAGQQSLKQDGDHAPES